MSTTPGVPRAASAAARAPTAAAAGRVRSQARAICPATDQCTWARRRPSPLPSTEPATTWVVESAKPRLAELRMTAVELASAVKPWGAAMSVSRLPMVRMMRQPPR